MKRKCLAILCALLLLTGCDAVPKTEPEQMIYLYFPQNVETAKGGDVLTAVAVDWSAQQDAPPEEQAALHRDLQVPSHGARR